MQKRNGRSCGKVLVWLTSGTCAAIALNPTVSGSFCLFRWFQWGERESGRNDSYCLAYLFCTFCIFPLSVALFFPPPRPYAGIVFLVFVLFRPCISNLFLFSTYHTYVFLVAFLIFLDHILQTCGRLFWSFLIFLWSGLYRCVIVPCTLPFHFIYLD